MDKFYLDGTFAYREDTLANWTSHNPVLEKGEPAIVRDGADGEWLKIGDGVTSWNDLPWKRGPRGLTGPKGENGKDAITDQTYSPESTNAQSGKAVAEAVENKEDKKEWQLIEDITLTEAVSRIDIPWEKMQFKEVHIEAKFVFADNTSKMVGYGLSGSTYWQYTRTGTTLYSIMDVYMSPLGRTIFDGTVSEYNYQLGGATAKLTNLTYNKNGNKEFVCSKAETSFWIITNHANGFAVGTIIKIWGR